MYDEPLVATNEGIMDVYKLLPNGEGFWWKEWIDENFIKVIKITQESLVELDKDFSFFHVVTLGQRNLGTRFMEHLEYNFFPPTSEINDEFSYRLFKWEDMDWLIVTVPVAKANTCYLSASAIGCRLANGVPHVFGMGAGGKGIGNTRGNVADRLPGGIGSVTESIFPLQSDRTFTLEPDHGRRGPVIGGIGSFDPAPEPKHREPDLLDLIMARRKKK